MSSTNILSYGDGLVYSGKNPYGAVGAKEIDGHVLGCPITSAVEPLEKMAAHYDRFSYPVRNPQISKASMKRVGASPDARAVMSYVQDRRLFHIKEDVEAVEGVGLDDGVINSLFEGTHEQIIKALFEVFQTGELTGGGQTEVYWNPYAELDQKPIIEAAAPWTDATSNPIHDIERAHNKQHRNKCSGSSLMVISSDAYNALIANEALHKSSLWTQGNPNLLQLSLPAPIVPVATTSKGGWLDAGMPWSAQQSQQAENIASPWFEFKGSFNGVFLLLDKQGLLPADTAIMLPHVDAHGHGYRLVYGAHDVGGQIITGAEISILKRSFRSGAALHSYCSFGLALTDDNPFHAICLKNLV